MWHTITSVYSDISASHSHERMVSKDIGTYPLFWLTQQYRKEGKAEANVSVPRSPTSKWIVEQSQGLNETWKQFHLQTFSV